MGLGHYRAELPDWQEDDVRILSWEARPQI